MLTRWTRASEISSQRQGSRNQIQAASASHLFRTAPVFVPFGSSHGGHNLGTPVGAQFLNSVVRLAGLTVVLPFCRPDLPSSGHNSGHSGSAIRR
jgi:hypothetical protein